MNDAYQLLFEASPHPYLVLRTDPSFTIRAVNSRYLSATGTDRHAIVGKGLFEVFPDNPVDGTATGVSDLKISLERVLREKVQDVMGVQKYDIPSQQANGAFEVRYWSPVNTPVFDENGSVVMIIHHVEDITDFVLVRECVSRDASIVQETAQAHSQRLEAEVLRRASEVKDANRQIKAMMELARKTEAALQQSEEQFRSSFENAAIGMALVATDGRWLQVNQALSDMLGYSKEELSSLTFQDITYPDDLATDMEFVQEMLGGLRKTYQMEKRYLRKNGDLVWVLLSVSLLRDKRGSPIHFISQVQNITESKKAEVAVAASEKEFRLLAEVMPQIVWITRADGWNIYFNHQWVDYTGLTLEESYGHGWNKPFHPDDKQRAWDAWQNAVNNNVPYSLECRLRRADGEYSWWLIRGAPMLNENGTIEKWFGTCTDINEIKAAEQELRISATAFDVQEGIVITDANEIIVRVNRAFIESTGYSAEELIGKTPRMLQSGRHDNTFYEEMWRSLRESGAWQGEIWDRRKNGEIYPKWLSIKAVEEKDGAVTHYVGSHTDITERKAAEDRIRDLAFYDPLTRLPNRRLLMDRLQRTLTSSMRSGHEGALLFVDLDHFKTLNDTLGHDKGDLLLQEVAQRLTTCIRDTDTLARLGGDEFVIVLEDLSKNPEDAAAQAETVSEKILGTLSQPYLLAGHEHHSTPSIGITLFGDQRENIAALMKQADIAMYQAKAAGRNTMRFFDPDLQVAIQARTAMEKDLHQGIEDGQFILYYQPQVEGRRVIGAEALIRWRHPERGMVPPIEFISLAEETGLILPLGLWVLESACTQIWAWAERAETADLTLAVNVSARQLRQTNFVGEVLSVVGRTNADPRKLKLELTESMLVDNIEEIIAKMNALRSHGIRFSLDDFGTGYSSLSYLKRLPLSQLKIDRSFVMDVLTDPNDAAIARTVIALGQSLGLKVIAEGVETEAQQEFLAEHGCCTYQGYLFGKPIPAEEFEKLVASMPEQKSSSSAGADVINGLRIMVIEDEPAILMALQLLLEGWRCEVLGAASGEEALVIGEQERWRFDAIIADYRLGAGMSGTQTASEFGRRSRRPIPTLIVTGDTAPERIEEIHASGFEIMHKPIFPEDLARKMAHILLWGEREIALNL